MKRAVFSIMLVSFVAICCFACAPSIDSMKQDMANEYASGKYDKDLIKTVSFDTDCPKENIKVLSRHDEMGSGQYKLEACGKELKYKRTGTVFHPADKSPY